MYCCMCNITVVMRYARRYCSVLYIYIYIYIYSFSIVFACVNLEQNGANIYIVYCEILYFVSKLENSSFYFRLFSLLIFFILKIG